MSTSTVAKTGGGWESGSYESTKISSIGVQEKGVASSGGYAFRICGSTKTREPNAVPVLIRRFVAKRAGRMEWTAS